MGTAPTVPRWAGPLLPAATTVNSAPEEFIHLSYPILSYPILSYPILSDPILSYPILSCPLAAAPPHHAFSPATDIIAVHNYANYILMTSLDYLLYLPK